MRKIVNIALCAAALLHYAAQRHSFNSASRERRTTCLMMLAGFETATHGEIKLGGVSINDIPPHKRGIDTVFQSDALFSHMTVGENLSFPLEVRGMGKDEREAKVKPLPK